MPRTNHTARPHTLATLSAAALLALSAGLPAAFADDDLLRGPSVRQTAPPGGPSFAEGRDPFMRAAAGQPLPYRMFLMAVRTLEPGRAPADVALSEEQVEAIRGFQSEHNQAILQYVQLHRAELETLIAAADLPTPRAMNGERGEGRPNARPGNQRDTDNANPRQRRQGAPADRRAQMQDSPEAKARQEAMRLFAQMNFNALPESRDPAVNAARARLAELRQGAPSHDEVRAKVWATLNEKQQQHALAVIEKAYRERAERRAAQEMTDNKRQPEGPNAPEARPGDRREGSPRRGPRPGTDNRRQPRPDA
jgi:hypothetical protein